MRVGCWMPWTYSYNAVALGMMAAMCMCVLCVPRVLPKFHAFGQGTRQQNRNLHAKLSLFARYDRPDLNRSHARRGVGTMAGMAAVHAALAALEDGPKPVNTGGYGACASNPLASTRVGISKHKLPTGLS